MGLRKAPLKIIKSEKEKVVNGWKLATTKKIWISSVNHTLLLVIGITPSLASVMDPNSLERKIVPLCQEPLILTAMLTVPLKLNKN